MGKNWLRGKNVIITGASSGIGAHLARLLLALDCKVLGVSRKADKAKDFADSLNNSSYSYYCFDVGVESEWVKFSDHLKEISFLPDVVINNAGIMPAFKRAQDVEVEVFEKVTSINYFSAIYSYTHLSPLLSESKTPSIINVSSSSALATLVGTAPYIASKTALRAYTECLYTERKDMYIAVVCPGFTKTEIFRDQKQGVDDGIIGLVSMPADKMARKILKRIRRRKRRIVVGIDAHLMSGFYRLFPKLSTRLIAWVLKKTKLPLFDGIFNPDNNKR